MVEKSWSEALVGVSYSPVDYFSIGLSVGIEHNPAVYRLAGSIWTGKGKNSFLLLWEKGDGTDNYWYKITANHKFSEKFSLGIRGWRYHGIGPIVDFSIVPKFGASMFIMPARDFEYKVNRLIAGVAVKI